MNHSSALVMNHQFEQGASPAGISYEMRPNEKTGLLLEAIRNQIHFYFSDQNLPADVFLNKLMQLDESGEGWISLKVVANFNKIKLLSTQLDLVREALKNSPLIMVSDDGLYIRRKTPIMSPQESAPEKRTIYVSKVPKTYDKESLSAVFGEFGIITRLDLPIDKKTGENKGIAFVEYKSEEEMLNAMQQFASSAKYKMVLKPFKAKQKVEGSKEESNQQQVLKGIKEPKPHKEPTGDIKSNEKSKAVQKKEKKENSGEQKGKETIGREVPITPDSIYDGQEAWSGRSRSNSKGARIIQTEWDPNPSSASQRPKLLLKGQMESGRALFVPVRNPQGPDSTKGFSAGRGKIMVR